MNTISLLRNGFENCVFLNRKPQTIEGIINRVISNPKVTLFPKNPNGIKVERIDDNSDKVTLSFDDEEVVSKWTWRKSVEGSSYVLSKIE